MKTYWLIWRLIAYRPWLYAVNILLWAVIHTSPVLPGLITKAFFDILTESNSPALGVWGVVAALMGVTVARCMVIFMGNFSSVVSRSLMSGLLRRNILARILERPGAAALPEAPGEVLNAMRDDVRQAEDTVDWLLDVVGQLVFTSIALATLISINARIALLVFIPLVAVVAVTRAAGSRLQQTRRASRKSTARVTGMISEMFGAVQAIQVAGAEARITNHFRRLNDHRRETMLKDRLLTQIIDSVSGNTVSLGTGLILLLSARMMIDGQFSVGDFALFVYYLTYLSDSTQFLGKWLALYKQTGVSIDRMEVLMQGAPAERLVEHRPIYLMGAFPEVDQPESAAADPLTEVVVTGLTYTYPESGRGVQEVNLRLTRGSFTVITGRVGSGKTTLLRAMTGLLPAQSGEIRWNNRVVTEPGTFFVPPRVASTPQIPLLFSDTLGSNILMGLSESKSNIPAAVRSAVMERDLPEMEHGLATMVGSRGVRLSGGQVQRAAAARMFVRQPDLLIFDDLSSALDVETERLLWERVFERPGATCLVVSHRRAALRRADHIIVLKDGRLTDEGGLEELLERCPEMQALWSQGAEGGSA